MACGLALLVDKLGTVEKVDAEDIQWLAADRAQAWQAGVIKQSLTTLLATSGVMHALNLRQ